MNLFEENKEPTVFNFGIDNVGSAYLLETTRWTKFLAIMGFLFIGILLVLAGIYFSTTTFLGPYNQLLSLVYGVISIIYIYPIIALFRFSILTKRGVQTGDVATFNEGLKQQRNLYRFIGIFMIITILIYGVIFGYMLINGLRGL